MAKKSTKKKVNRGNSCEHGIPKSKNCARCNNSNTPVCEHGVKADGKCKACHTKLVVEKVTKKLPTSEKRKQLMEAVQSVVDKKPVRKNDTIHVINFGTHQVPFIGADFDDVKVPDNYTITLKPTLVGDEEVDIPIFKHKKLFKIEVEESKSDWPMLYVTGLIQGIALAACVWMIHKLNINWHDIF